MSKALTTSKPSSVRHPRWNGGRLRTVHGYVKLRVGRSHPLADPNGYAYEHLVIWVSAGNPRPGPGMILHHKDGNKTDNRLQNLELLSRTEHAKQHHAMLSDEDVCAVREAYAAGGNGVVLAEKYGVPMQRIYKLIKGEARRGAGGPITEGSLRPNASRARAARAPRIERQP